MQAQGNWPIQNERTYGGKMKTCSKCKELKPFTEFHKDRTKKDGHVYHCKVCKKEYHRLWHEENREAEIERMHRRYQENKEAIDERMRRWREEKNSQQPGCVYQIVNSINGKVYVGETTRGELRWIDHLRYLRGNYHENPNLQADFNEFGEDVFEWSIIQELPKDRKLLEREETNTIQRLLAEGKELYNIVLN
jgi:hypothetical protein